MVLKLYESWKLEWTCGGECLRVKELKLYESKIIHDVSVTWACVMSSNSYTNLLENGFHESTNSTSMNA